MRALMGLLAGTLFGVGLGIGGMLRPDVVLGFLDVFGDFNPRLMFVMAGAIGVFLPVWLAVKGRKPLLGGKMAPAPSKQLDTRLFAGAALFGIGWGIAGICPGPGIAIQARPCAESLSFVAAMLAGMFVYKLVDATRGRKLAKA